jgi:large subunit ribosomal protein L4
MESQIYTSEGKKKGVITLPENVFGVAWNDALMHQVVTSMEANARTPVAHAKPRGEVRGGGKKPWQQKGTGRARHGSIRSPIWKGGGVTHGPLKDKDYSRAIPKKMRAKALFMALSRKLRDGEVVFVDSFGLDKPQTAAAKKALVHITKAAGMDKFMTKKRNVALVAFADPTEASQKSFRNLGHVATTTVRNLNPVVVLRSTYLVIENPEAAIAIMAQRTNKSISAKSSGVTK